MRHWMKPEDSVGSYFYFILNVLRHSIPVLVKFSDRTARARASILLISVPVNWFLQAFPCMLRC